MRARKKSLEVTSSLSRLKIPLCSAPEAAPIKSAGRESAGLQALSVSDSVSLQALSIGESVGLPPDSLPALFIGAASGSLLPPHNNKTNVRLVLHS